MLRRLLLCLVLVGLPAGAQDLSALTQRDAGRGLREALAQGTAAAVGKLSAPNGFLGDDRVRIPLPPTLEQAQKLLKRVGLGDQGEQLATTMNRAAEAAVVEAKPILLDAIRKMTLADAKAILSGPDDAATQYFRKTSGEAIFARFRPKVVAATEKVKLAEYYDRFAGKASELGLVAKEDASLDDYVTRKATDGLFVIIAEEEKAIRADPMGQASKLLKTVFGELRP